MVFTPLVMICAEPATAFHKRDAFHHCRACPAGPRVNNAGAIVRVDVDGGRVGDDRERLLRHFKRRIDDAVRRGQSDQRRERIRGGERQEEMCVDRDLRALLLEKLQGRLSNRFPRPARRRHLDANARRGEIDHDDVHPQNARGDVSGARDVRDTEERAPHRFLRLDSGERETDGERGEREAHL